MRLLLACVAHLERAAAARPNDGFVLRCLGDSLVDTAKAMRRLAGEDDSGLMRATGDVIDDDDDDEDNHEAMALSAESTLPRHSILDPDDDDITRSELGSMVTFSLQRSSLRKRSGMFCVCVFFFSFFFFSFVFIENRSRIVARRRQCLCTSGNCAPVLHRRYQQSRIGFGWFCFV